MFEKWYFSVVLIPISLIMSKNECLLCFMPLLPFQAFSGGSDGKESTCNAGGQGLIPGWQKTPGEGNGNPLQYSCLENPMDRGAWQVIVHGVAKESDTTK